MIWMVLIISSAFLYLMGFVFSVNPDNGKRLSTIRSNFWYNIRFLSLGTLTAPNIFVIYFQYPNFFTLILSIILSISMALAVAGIWAMRKKEYIKNEQYNKEYFGY